MVKQTKLFIKQILGWGLIIVGFSGIFLPILPGWLLIFVGLEIIGIHLAFFDRIKAYVKKKIKNQKVKIKGKN